MKQDNKKEPISKTLVVYFGEPEEGVERVGKKLVMSYGLVQTLAGFFRDLDQVGNLSLDYTLQTQLLNEVLDDRDEKGNRKNPDKNFAYDLSLDEGKRVNEWVGAHISDFFLSGLQKQVEAIEELSQVIGKLKETEKVLESKQQ